MTATSATAPRAAAVPSAAAATASSNDAAVHARATVADRPRRQRALVVDGQDVAHLDGGRVLGAGVRDVHAVGDLVAALDRSLTRDRHELLREEDPNFTGGLLPLTENRANSGTQEVELGFIANEESLLNEANAALARIEAGTFGSCESCGKAIAKARLDALPYARQCIHCARVERPAAG